MRLAVQNEIPVAGGLGSSAAATVAGVALGICVNGQSPSQGHSAALRQRKWKAMPTMWAPRCWEALWSPSHAADGTVVAVRKRWPKMIRLIVVTPAT